jgi:uncharacterized protein YbjT (DUF2867 family)
LGAEAQAEDRAGAGRGAQASGGAQRPGGAAQQPRGATADGPQRELTRREDVPTPREGAPTPHEDTPTPRDVFVTGATGYLGSRLAAGLLRRGHRVRALVRAGSGRKLPEGCEPVVGDALDAGSFAGRVAPSDTFVQLVGVPRPSPAKAREFREIDLRSVRASVEAAGAAGVRHFVYVSVAQPAPVMRAYIEVRAEGERLIRESRMDATILRPWYVLGPGHRWPLLLLPVYKLLELLPQTRDGALRLGLVQVEQMIRALVRAVEHPPQGVRVVEVQEIKRGDGG